MKYIIISIFFLHSIVITSFGAEGFFKDYFHDQGYHLSGQKHNDHIKTFLNYSIEPNFTTTSSFTKNRINGTAIDSNGVLLYPDNSPRFRIYYHSGGYFSHLDDCGGAIAHDRLRTFVANGGSWVGSCAGAGAASLAAYPGGTAMVGVYPHYYQDRGDRFLSDIKIMDMTHPIAIYYNNFLGYRDSIVDSTWFLSGGYFPDNVDPPYNFTTFLAKSVTPGYSISDKWAIVCYKDTNHINSGRVVLSGAHPEAGRSYTKKGKFFAAMCKFAAEGNGAPKIKGMLLNNLSRTMNDNTKSGYEKIGDKQYHHFTVFVPEEAETLEVTIAGETGYDFNLYLKKGGFAFTSNSLKSATGLGENKVIILTKSEGLSKGLWYVGVECATEVTVVETRQKPDSLGMDSIQYDSYSGKTGVLNGVSYIVNARMDYVDATAPTAPANLSYGQDTIKPGILLSWKESSDNETGIAYYNIYRNGEKIASVQTLSYKDGSADLRMATDYSYAVASVNGAGLESQQTLLQAHTSDYLIVDDGDNSRYYKTSYTGDWPLSTASGSFNGGGSVYSKTVGATYTWEASVTTGKLHKIQIWYPSFASRAGAVPISVFDGDTKVFSTVLNQKVLGSRWIDITEIVLSSETARVVVTSTSTDSSTSADAVRFIVNSGSTASEGDSLENSFKLNSFVSVSPNPFNPVTSIRIVSGHIKNGIVKVSVFNNCGQLVNVVKSSYSGYSATVNWDASNRPGGLYFFKVNNGKQTQTVKAMLLK